MNRRDKIRYNTAMSKENPTIMVVEDENLLLQAITKKIKLSGMDVLSCSSGQQAVDYLESLDELPDAVWLDYYLKDMNGLAFMQALKANPKWADIPVLVVSNSASPDKVTNMLGLGAKKYILKAEYRLDEIIEMIRDFIASGSAEAAASPAPGVTAPPSEPTASDDTPTPAPAAVATDATQEKDDD
jgi:two-component system, chemotaxis family, chemotaxis protein CheY